MRVLLTGATGHIGRQLLKHLVSRGDDVCVLALPGTTQQIRKYDNVTVVEGDLSDEDALLRATDSARIVYHLAGSVIGAAPREFSRVNIEGTENLLRACESSKIQRFVFTSSVAVYAPAPTPEGWPITEKSPIRTQGRMPLMTYAHSKIAAEKAILRRQDSGVFECTIIRAPAVYSKD